MLLYVNLRHVTPMECRGMLKLDTHGMVSNTQSSSQLDISVLYVLSVVQLAEVIQYNHKTMRWQIYLELIHSATQAKMLKNAE